MKIYIASALPNLPIAREWAVSLRGAGHTVTSTWHEDAGNTVDAEAFAPHGGQRAIAEKCISEVLGSRDILWLHGNAYGRVGAIAEVGIAIACGINVHAFSLDGQPPPSVFGALCVSVCDVADLLARLS